MNNTICKNLVQKIKQNALWLILIYSGLFSSIVLVTLTQIKEIQMNQLTSSLADGFVINNNIYSTGFLIIPFSLLITMITFKHDFLQSNIIRQKSRSSLWAKQMIQLLFQNIFFCLFVVISIVIATIYFSEYGINWNFTESVYYATTEKLNDIDLIAVVTLYFFNLLLLLLINNGLLLGSYWLFSNYHFGWILYIILFVWDLIMPRNLSLMFGRLSIDYKRWLDMPSILVNSFCFLLILIAIIPMLNYFIKRSEFFDN